MLGPRAGWGRAWDAWGLWDRQQEDRLGTLDPTATCSRAVARESRQPLELVVVSWPLTMKVKGNFHPGAWGREEVKGAWRRPSETLLTSPCSPFTVQQGPGQWQQFMSSAPWMLRASA